MGATVSPLVLPALLSSVATALILAALIAWLACPRPQWRPRPPGDDEPPEPWEPPDPGGISIPVRSSYQLAA